MKFLALKDPPPEIQEQLINAAIVAGHSFFTTLVGITAAGIRPEPGTSLLAAAIAAGLSFFSSLAIQRGLKRGE